MCLGKLTGIYGVAEIEDNGPSILRASVSGGNFYVHMNNLFENTPLNGWVYHVDCNNNTIGYMDTNSIGEQRWTYVPNTGDVGSYDWEVKCYYGNRYIKSITKTFQIGGNTSSETCQLTMCGDSTLERRCINTQMRLDASNMTVTLIGTNDDTGTDSEGGSQAYDHEGRSSWTLNNYCDANASPFASGGVVDFSDWVSTFSFTSGDIFYFCLGINDMIFEYTDNDATDVIDSWHTDLERLLGLSDSPPSGSLRYTVPGVIILIDLISIPAHLEGWRDNCVDRWQYMKNIRRLRQTIKEYDTTAYRNKNIYMMGSNLVMDPYTSYTTDMEVLSDVDDGQVEKFESNNRVHFSTPDAWKIGDMIASNILAIKESI